MVAELASVDQRQDLVIDSKLMNEGWTWSGSGANPWHLDKQTESVLFLTNESGQTARIGFEVTANNVHYYLTELKLQPHETRVINLRSLRDAQAADFKQHLVPATATDGAVNWVRIDNVPVEGRLVVIERSGGVASNYDCCLCSCPLSYNHCYVTPNSCSLLPGSSMLITCTGVYYGCNNTEYYYNDTSDCTWWSSNTSVVKMDSQTAGKVDGVGGGSAYVRATLDGYSYTWENPGCLGTPVDSYSDCGVTGQIPTFVLRLSASCNPYTCGTGDGATQINELVYRVLDQNGNGIDVANMQIAEQTTRTQDTCPPVQIEDSITWKTDSSGIMIGADYLWACKAVGTSCYTTTSQSFTVTALGIQYPVLVRLSNGTSGSHNVNHFTWNNGVGSCPTCTVTP